MFGNSPVAASVGAGFTAILYGYAGDLRKAGSLIGSSVVAIIIGLSFTIVEYPNVLAETSNPHDLINSVVELRPILPSVSGGVDTFFLFNGFIIGIGLIVAGLRFVGQSARVRVEKHLEA